MKHADEGPRARRLRTGAACLFRLAWLALPLTPTLSTVVYAVHLGGGGSGVRAIAVGREGSACIPIQPVRANYNNVFVMKINTSGTVVVYSSSAVVSYTPALFAGFGAARPRSVVAINQDNSINDTLHPAHLGDIVTVFATALGQTSPSSADGEMPAQLQYVGCSPGTVIAGDRINAVIPVAARTGPAVAVTINTSAGELKG